MALLIEDIAAALATAGVGTVATDIFVSHIPDTPEAAIAVVDNGGTNNAQTDGEKHNIQVLVRNPVYATGASKADAVFTALDDNGFTLTGGASCHCRATTLPLPLGLTSGGLNTWSLNFMVTK